MPARDLADLGRFLLLHQPYTLSGHNVHHRRLPTVITYTVDTYGADLTKVTDHNGDSITVATHTGGGRC